LVLAATPAVVTVIVAELPTVANVTLVGLKLVALAAATGMPPSGSRASPMNTAAKRRHCCPRRVWRLIAGGEDLL
jgi:hypothetical protein